MNDITATSAHPVLPELPGNLLAYMRAGALGLVMTVGDDGYPTDAFTWMVAVDNKRLRFGADHGSRTLGNLQRDARAAVQIIAPENMVFLVKGTVRQIADDIEAVDMGIGLWELEVAGARDQSWPGAAPLPLAVQWSGDTRETMVKTEQAVYEEMRNAVA